MKKDLFIAYIGSYLYIKLYFKLYYYILSRMIKFCATSSNLLKFKKLTFGDEFNQSVDNLPSKIKKLIFGI